MKYHKCADVEKEGLLIELEDDGSAYHNWNIDNSRFSGISINYCPFCGIQLSFREKSKIDVIVNGQIISKDKPYKCLDQDEHYIYLEDVDDNQICLTYKEYEEYFGEI